MIEKHICSIILSFLLIIPYTQAQKTTLSLGFAIQLACENSLEFKIAYNQFKSDAWTYWNYKASLKPMLYLDGIIPSYNRSIDKITLPSGEDVFVKQNQAYSTLNLGIRQHIGITGGILAVNTSLNRIDVFGNTPYKRYSIIPVSIAYQQSNIGYNHFKWKKIIEPLKHEFSQRHFIARIESLGLQTVHYFFEVLLAQSDQKLAKQNLAHADTLYYVSEQRFNLGTVSKNELLQLRLNLLNAQNQFIQDSVSLVLAKQQFGRFIGSPYLPEWELEVPDKFIPYFEIPIEEALRQSKKNSQILLNNKLQKLEAQRSLNQIRSENKLNFSIQTNLGISNTSSQFLGLLKQLENQQNIVVSFSIPILDWGQNKTKKQSAEANLTLIENQSDQENLQFEQELGVYISKWNQQKARIEVAEESKNISEQNYSLEIQRYLSGKININDLNIAQKQRDQAFKIYIIEIKTYWDLYYSIRQYTLYDFELNKKLVSLF